MALQQGVIPEKIFFKIGEVCEIVGVQAHVLRYWESEFSMLSPQKNKSGQRSYRRKEVETALKIKQLLYNEMFTIAGARKKLQSDMREGNAKAKPQQTPSQPSRSVVEKHSEKAPQLFETHLEPELFPLAIDAPPAKTVEFSTTKDAEAIRQLGVQLLELRAILKNRPTQ